MQRSAAGWTDNFSDTPIRYIMMWYFSTFRYFFWSFLPFIANKYFIFFELKTIYAIVIIWVFSNIAYLETWMSNILYYLNLCKPRKDLLIWKFWSALPSLIGKNSLTIPVRCFPALPLLLPDGSLSPTAVLRKKIGWRVSMFCTVFPMMAATVGVNRKICLPPRYSTAVQARSVWDNRRG